MFYFATQLRACTRRHAAALPGLLALVVTLFARAAEGVGRSTFTRGESRIPVLLVIAWIVALLLVPPTRGGSAISWSPIPPALRKGAAVAWALAGVLVGGIGWSCAWLALEGLFVPRTAWIDLGGAAALLGAAGAAILVTLNFALHLPRAAAVAASGVWLLLSTRPLGPEAPFLRVLANTVLFPVSPGFLAAEEASQPGVPVRALASVAAFDLGLFLLLVAGELRRRR